MLDFECLWCEWGLVYRNKAPLWIRLRGVVILALYVSWRAI